MYYDFMPDSKLKKIPIKTLNQQKNHATYTKRKLQE